MTVQGVGPFTRSRGEFGLNGVRPNRGQDLVDSKDAETGSRSVETCWETGFVAR